MEQAVWIDWRRPEIAASLAQRIYLGHETCANLLPDLRSAKELAHDCLDAGIAVTLMTPFVSDEAFEYVIRLTNTLCDILGSLELVSSDWGILRAFCGHSCVTPIIGRPLTAQPTDPRIMRLLSSEERTAKKTARHAEAVVRSVKKIPASQVLKKHFQQVWIDRPHVQQYLMSLGISRAEISYPLQGIYLNPIEGWRYSLHVSDIMLAVMASCEGSSTGSFPIRCRLSSECSGKIHQWSHPAFAQRLYRSCNGIYYQPQIESDEEFPPAIDRIVLKKQVPDYPSTSFSARS